MSGLYIKGLKIPDDTPILFCIHPDGKVFADEEGNWAGYKAIPVHDHGRLVDAEDVNNHIHGWVDLRTCPTIIPADKEGEA